MGADQKINHSENKMALIATQNIVITISKLIKNSELSQEGVLTDQQLTTLLETLPSLIEELVEDGKLIVEVESALD